MVLEVGGGIASLAGPLGAAEVAPAGAEAAETPEGSLDDGKMGCEAESAATGVGAASWGLIAGGVEASSEGSVSARVTITESLASPVMPPASARTSNKVTWRSAW